MNIFRSKNLTKILPLLTANEPKPVIVSLGLLLIILLTHKQVNILECSDLRFLGTGFDCRITGVVFATGVKLIIYNVCMNAHKIFNITTIFT